MSAAHGSMGSLFADAAVADWQQDALRNIVSLRRSQDLFDDLSDDPAAWSVAQAVDDEIKPPPYTSRDPVIHRPFEDARWFDAVAWPFRNWQSSRLSDGAHGVWYGSRSIETTVHESVFHWVHGLLAHAGFQHEPVRAERKVYVVHCSAALLDVRTSVRAFPQLLHPADYSASQRVGARIAHEGHPGLLLPSVRHPGGDNLAVFNPAVLSRPRLSCQLGYRLDGDVVWVDKRPGDAWMCLRLDQLALGTGVRPRG